MEHAQHCDLLEAEVPRVAAAFRNADPSATVPTCPDWTVADLADHLGSIHRWVVHLVDQRITVPTGRRSLGLEPAPEDATADELAGYLTRGMHALVDALRGAEADEPVWGWGGDTAGWWSRRQLHETLVHRIDAQLAAGDDSWPSTVAPEVAVDCVDEMLANVVASAAFSPKVAELRGDGSIHLHATDADGEWMITLTPDGFEITHEHGKGTVAARGEAADLLGALYQRSGVDRLEVFGDAELLDRWIAKSAMG